MSCAGWSIQRRLPCLVIKHQLLEQEGILIVQPDGPLTKEDFETLAKQVDPYILTAGKLNGLMIDVAKFPGWKDFAGAASHFKFIRDHQSRIKRLCVVTDSDFLKELPAFVNHFASAKLRRFSSDQRNEAMKWLSGEDVAETPAASIRFSQLEDKPVMWIEIDGEITRAGYLKLLEKMKAQIAEGAPVSYLIELKNIDGVEMGAMWEDLKFGLGNLKHMKRIALVADQKWVEWFSKITDPMTRVEIRTFHKNQEYEAWEWVTAD